MAISSEEFDTYISTTGLFPTPCHLRATLRLTRKDGSGYITELSLAGWDENGEPVVVLPNGRLGGLTMGMQITDVVPAR